MITFMSLVTLFVKTRVILLKKINVKARDWRHQVQKCQPKDIQNFLPIYLSTGRISSSVLTVKDPWKWNGRIFVWRKISFALCIVNCSAGFKDCQSKIWKLIAVTQDLDFEWSRDMEWRSRSSHSAEKTRDRSEK